MTTSSFSALMYNPCINLLGSSQRLRAVPSLAIAHAATFPTERRALMTDLPPIRPLTHLVPGVADNVDVDLDAPDEYQWRLEEVDVPLREALCTLQGLRAPREVPA